jgi:chromosome segregation ATPase
MFKSRLLLSLVAFAVSVGISFLTGRDFGRALLAGLVTFFASLAGVAVAERRYYYLFEQRAAELMAHIRSLQHKRSEAYEALLALSEEHDRLTQNLDSPPLQTVEKPNAAVSWNLANPSVPDQTPSSQAHLRQPKLQALERQEAELKESLSSTLAAKQRAELNLTTTQAELNQIKAQILEQKNTRETIGQEITTLTHQKQRIEADLSTLQPQINELERYRSELDQFLLSAEPKRQQVETGSKSLQAAIGQLQLQISSLHEELGQLETQILDRRQQKEDLDRDVAALKGTLAKDVTNEVSIVPANQRSIKTVIKSAAPDLPIEWTQFFTQLSASELAALGAIAKQKNLMPTLKKIAEDTLTMPELLIDSINERALDTIGDMILEPGSGNTPTMIAEEYRSIVQKLLQ